MSLAEPESSVLKTAKWLEVLENKRKRPHKLAHDIGAGAPCLVCKEKCKGLNLHFWRKLCIECKCRKEDHEVEEEEDYAQFEILFGAKKVKRTTLKFNTQNKSFDWIPPNVAPDLVIDYLKSIPESKLPMSNSEGARYRKRQLEKQVPLHDVDPNACFNLSDKEMKEFQKYLNNLKDNVIGQGKILKYQLPKMVVENYIQGMPPNMMAADEEYVSIKPQGAEILSQLAIDKMPEHSALSQPLCHDSYPAGVKFFKNFQPISSNTNSSQSYKTQPIINNIGNSNFQDPFLKHDVNVSNPKPFHSFNQIQRKDNMSTEMEKMLFNNQSNLSLKRPSSFITKNLPIQDKQNNNVQADDNCNISFPTVEEEEESNLVQNNPSFHQDPYNASLCRDLLTKFNELNIPSIEVPFTPVQESGTIYISKKNDASKFPFKDESEDVPSTFPSPPSTCQQCLEILYPEEVVIQTAQGGDSALWHAKCFVCETCKELLVDLMYFYHKEKVYCGRHYAEIMKIPRCYGCDELIFVKEYTIAEENSYHVDHFCCYYCDEPLGGKQYISKDSFPVCLDCYQIKYGKNCRTCGYPITASEQRVSWKNLDFHVSPECFRCTQCKNSLLGGKFMVKNCSIFCSRECVQMFPGKWLFP